MRLFDFQRAPNPRRVRMLLAEKGVEIPLVPVNLYALEQLSPEFLSINPGGTLPTLETDDGTYLTESVAIGRYLESLYPEPALFGTGNMEQAQVLMWNNIVENEGLDAVQETLRNWSPGFRGRALPGPVAIDQMPALIERGTKRCLAFFDRIESQLANHEWLATGSYSFADISLLAAVEFATWVEIEASDGRPRLADWYRRAASRPSARVSAQRR